jgi:Tfp pilus assembly protein PilO
MKEKEVQEKKDTKTVDNVDKQTEKVLEDKISANEKVPVGMKIVIAVLAVIMLGLLGYIMYQAGKGSVNNKNNELVASDDVNSERREIIPESQNNSTADAVETNNRAEVRDIISRNSISNNDLNKLDDELEDISTNYDDLEKVGTDLQKWPN